ncbi:MAG: TetR/AcrR family transcriptional regulator [Lachnospiraceae bacterium]|nr:TetR/AcrR family transcriptional regulator [Lachnospiraceae bacterium]
MARKESVTIDRILDASFTMTREEGFRNITARKVAAKVGCSTQPIFRVYKNMEELWDAVYDKAVQYFQDYISLFPRTGKRPFSNLGLAYIAFAKEEKQLFELLFLSFENSKKSMYEILNGDNDNVMFEIALARGQGCINPEEMFDKMWIFIHGAACLALTDNFQLSGVETLAMLEKTYDSFANA